MNGGEKQKKERANKSNGLPNILRKTINASQKVIIEEIKNGMRMANAFGPSQFTNGNLA